jgi:hypothetical protein
MKPVRGIFASVLFCLSLPAMGQMKLDLASLLAKQQFDAVNRSLSLSKEQPGAVEMNAAQGDGLAILSDVPFETGTIQVELLGENSPGRSFIGIAFNIADPDTYEAVYFRPFNFVATEPVRKAHMVQYICHPDYTWSRLREERTGEFENEISAPPDPDGWFKATINVSESGVEVFVDGIAAPVLKVERLTGGTSGKIGLWVGNGSSGRFRNLVLQ